MYQADYCYSLDFSRCSVFLAWAARNAAEPAFVTEAAQKAWGSGISAPEDAASATDGTGGTGGPATGSDEASPSPTPESGLFGPPEPAPDGGSEGTEQLDWVSASAWAEAPWDERAEMEAAELEALAEEELEAESEDDADTERAEEATQAPKVPAALPMRRRKPPQEPIRSRGSGEWIYADPPGREPLVSRRSGVTPTVLLAVLGGLLVSIIVFLLAAQLGGDDDPAPAAAASPSPVASLLPLVTAAPVVTAEPTEEPSPTPNAALKTWTVKPGQSLSWIAARPKVNVDLKLLQCINRITNPDIIQPGQVLRIPPEGYVCPRGWRRSTPEPLE